MKSLEERVREPTPVKVPTEPKKTDHKHHPVTEVALHAVGFGGAAVAGGAAGVFGAAPVAGFFGATALSTTAIAATGIGAAGLGFVVFGGACYYTLRYGLERGQSVISAVLRPWSRAINAQVNAQANTLQEIQLGAKEKRALEGLTADQAANAIDIKKATLERLTDALTTRFPPHKQGALSDQQQTDLVRLAKGWLDQCSLDVIMHIRANDIRTVPNAPLILNNVVSDRRIEKIIDSALKDLDKKITASLPGPTTVYNQEQFDRIAANLRGKIAPIVELLPQKYPGDAAQVEYVTKAINGGLETYLELVKDLAIKIGTQERSAERKLGALYQKATADIESFAGPRRQQVRALPTPADPKTKMGPKGIRASRDWVHNAAFELRALEANLFADQDPEVKKLRHGPNPDRYEATRSLGILTKIALKREPNSEAVIHEASEAIKRLDSCKDHMEIINRSAQNHVTSQTRATTELPQFTAVLDNAMHHIAQDSTTLATSLLNSATPLVDRENNINNFLGSLRLWIARTERAAERHGNAILF